MEDIFLSTKKSLNRIFKLYLNFIILSICFSFIYCQNEEEQPVCFPNENYFNIEGCFNNLFIFNSSRYQASNFAMDKNGGFVIGFSEDNDDTYSKLLYGLKNDGSNYFSEESSTFEKKFEKDDLLDDTGYYNYYGIYKSINLFISLKNDKKKNEYLFSINSYNSMVELHDLNNINNNNSNLIWSFNDFFNLDEDFYIFPYKYHIFELKKESSYIITFVPSIIINEEMANTPFIKKFSFKSFDSEAYEEITSVTYEKYINHFVLDNFLMDDKNFFAILSCDYSDDYSDKGYYAKLRNLGATSPNSPNNQYPQFYIILSFFNNKLKNLFFANNIQIQLHLYTNDGDIYFKSIYLKDAYIAFIYITSLPSETMNLCFVLEIYKMNILISSPYAELIEPEIIGLINSYIPFNEILSDIVKIDNNRLAFICTDLIEPKGQIRPSDPMVSRRLRKGQEQSRHLMVSLIDFYSGYFISNKRYYYINLDNYNLHNQISGYVYNGYLLFSSTATKLPIQTPRALDDSLDYFSLFMIFGYANGTDGIINISQFFNDISNYQEEKTFFDYLYENLTIENNIFGYEALNSIKIVSIPEEIILLDEENNRISNGSYLYGRRNYELFQNKNLTKTSQYYYLDYQYILKEGNSLDNNKADKDIENLKRQLENGGDLKLRSLDNLDGEGKRIYYGRTNRLKFKLCHDYCETCDEISMENNDQKCSSCPPIYQYDYRYYIDNSFDRNCVPEGYFYDFENSYLELCNTLKVVLISL